jgi:hypothetical protein
MDCSARKKKEAGQAIVQGYQKSGKRDKSRDNNCFYRKL